MVSLSKVRNLNSDYIPVISTLTNLKELVSYNFFQIPIAKPLNQVTLIEKTFFQRVILLIPVFGNLAIYLFRQTSLTSALDAALAGKKIFGSLNVLQEDLDNEQNLQKVLNLLKQGSKQNHSILYAYLSSLSSSDKQVINEIKNELFLPKNYELLKLFYQTTSMKLPSFLEGEQVVRSLDILNSQDSFQERYKKIFLAYYCQSSDGFTFSYFNDYYNATFTQEELRQISFKLLFFLSQQNPCSEETVLSNEEAFSQLLSIKDEGLRMRLLDLILWCERKGLQEFFFKRVEKEIEWGKKVNRLPFDTLVLLLNHCFHTPAFSMAQKMLENRSKQRPVERTNPNGATVRVRWRYRLSPSQREILGKHDRLKALLMTQDAEDREDSRKAQQEASINRGTPINHSTSINELLARIARQREMKDQGK